MEVLVEEPPGGSDHAFVVDYNVKSRDGGLVVVFKELENESEAR